MSTRQQQHSKLWEEHIRKECSDLEAAGLAGVDKNWEAPTVPGKSIPREPSKPDFSGWIDGGRHVVFEAKATLSETSFSFHDVAEHQADHLERAWEDGAVAFLYILDGNRRRWVVPWGVVEEVQQERASYPFGEMTRHRKRRGETWLDTLTRLEVIDGSD